LVAAVANNVFKPEEYMKKIVLSAWLLGFATTGFAQGQELNLYSARHYQTDEALYTNFTRATGIKINRIELGDEPLLERLRSEGAKSPADVVLLVDAARLFRAQSEGLFAPVESKILRDRIPMQYRAQDNSWFGFSTRARVIVYNKATVKPEDVDTYAELADPKNKGKLCIRSGSHPYNLSLFASMIARSDEAQTEKILKGINDNMARAPKGGDTDQIRAVASGECGIAVTNTYYWVRLLKSTKPEDKEVISKVALVWPDQTGNGTHMNLSGGAVAKNAPNRANAIKFLEYLASDEAQAYFANGNNEWPTVKGVALKNPELESLGKFKADELPLSAIAPRTVLAQEILDKVGFK
jgi:iron(III) transport system substrate-binding protein